MWRAPDPQLSLTGVLHQVAARLYSDDTRVFMPPLTQAAVSIQRPRGGGTHIISFGREHSVNTVVGDALFFVASKIPTPASPGALAYMEAFATALFECSLPRVTQRARGGQGAWEVLVAAVGAMASCWTEMTTGQNRELKAELVKRSLSESQLKLLFNAKTARTAALKAKSILRALAAVEVIAYFFEIAQDERIGSTPWQIQGVGRPAGLGDWKPTCSDPVEDSNRLSRNLTLREPFRSNPNRLWHTFDEWRPSAEAAVAPLEDCGDSHLAQVAADIDNTWATSEEDVAKGIVQDLILAMVAPDPTGDYSAITAGDSHTCALTADGTVVCWGDDTHGQLFEPDGQYRAVAAGARHTCAIRSDNTIECWGDNAARQLDAPTGQYRAVTAGRNHSLRHRQRQHHRMLGRLSARRLASSSSKRNCTPPSPPGQYRDVAAGYIHTCAIRSDNTIECWGTNNDGQLDAPTGQYRAITAGRNHSCAIRTDDTIACWGDDYDNNNQRPPRPTHRHRRQLPAHLRHTHRPDDHMLGQHLIPNWTTRPTRPPRRPTHRHRRRRKTLMRHTHQPNHHMLGRQQLWPDRTTPRHHLHHHIQSLRRRCIT